MRRIMSEVVSVVAQNNECTFCYSVLCIFYNVYRKYRPETLSSSSHHHGDYVWSHKVNSLPSQPSSIEVKIQLLPYLLV